MCQARFEANTSYSTILETIRAIKKYIKDLLKDGIRKEAQSVLVPAVNCWTVSVDKLEDGRSSLFCGAYEMGFNDCNSRRKTDKKTGCTKLSNVLCFILKNRKFYV